MLKRWNVPFLLTALLVLATVPFDIRMAYAAPAVAKAAKVIYPPKTTLPSESEIEALGKTWGEALASRDARTISALYDSDAVLLATFSDMLDSKAKIFDYFVGLTKNEGLKVQFNEQVVRILDETTASNSGLYTFSFVENGKTVYVPARYTFVYEKRDGKWLIVEHHSSVRPEKPSK